MDKRTTVRREPGLEVAVMFSARQGRRGRADRTKLITIADPYRAA